MLKFEIQGFLDKVRQAVVNEELGVEKMNEFFIHESLTRDYITAVVRATERALRDSVYPDEPPEIKPEIPGNRPARAFDDLETAQP